MIALITHEEWERLCEMPGCHGAEAQQQLAIAADMFERGQELVRVELHPSCIHELRNR